MNPFLKHLYHKLMSLYLSRLEDIATLDQTLNNPTLSSPLAIRRIVARKPASWN